MIEHITWQDLFIMSVMISVFLNIFHRFDSWYMYSYLPKKVKAIDETPGDWVIQLNDADGNPFFLKFNTLKQYKQFIDNNHKTYARLLEDLSEEDAE